MHHDTPTLSDRDVLTHAREALGPHLPLEAEGYTCTTDDLLNVLLGVAAHRATVESVCRDLVGTPDADTIRKYFNEELCLEDLPELERNLNAALAGEIPARVGKHARDVAMDFQDRPYYGKTPQATGLWVRGRARDGTTRFYRVATAYVMQNNLRVTLAIRFVLPEDDTVTIVRDLQNAVQRLKIRVQRLFLDKGFGGIALLDYLEGIGQPAVIACTIRGTTGGTRALCQGNKSYRTTYTFHGADQAAFTAELAVCRVFTTAKRTKRMQRRSEWMIFILIHLDWSPRQARRQYRRRFGIESSYRCSGQVRGWTTSKNPAYRFVLTPCPTRRVRVALSFFLLNVWVHLRWLFTQVPRRGGRWLDTRRFELTRLAQFITRALEACYGCVHGIAATAVPRP